MTTAGNVHDGQTTAGNVHDGHLIDNGERIRMEVKRDRGATW